MPVDIQAALIDYLDDDRPEMLTGRAGFGTARIQLSCWGDGTHLGHLQANALMAAAWASLDSKRVLMGSVNVQHSKCENGQKASPPPSQGKAKEDAQAVFEVVLFYDDP